MQNASVLSHLCTTPLGEVIVAATDSGICLLEFTSQSQRVGRAIKNLQKRLNTEVISGVNRHIEQVQNELDDYFNGQRKVFSVSLDPQGTNFQQSVWQALLHIPYGQTASYSQQAQILNNPTAVRAVANANGANKISILIPCHRVIGSNGKLTGYGGGIERKQWLLDLERRNYSC